MEAQQNVDEDDLDSEKEQVCISYSATYVKVSFITSENFVMWILSLKRRGTDEPPGFEMVSLHRSALFNLFRDFRITYSPNLELDIKSHFKGLRREKAKDIQQGGASVKVGKDPLSFGLYRFIAKQFYLNAEHPEFIVAQCMLTLSWNLMCRVSNCIDIKAGHITWSDDALCIYFATMKNDQNLKVVLPEAVKASLVSELEDRSMMQAHGTQSSMRQLLMELGVTEIYQRL